MKRWFAILALIGLFPVAALANPLDLQLRSEQSVPLTATQFDQNYTAIENAIHALQPITLQAAPCTVPQGCTGATSLSGILKGNAGLAIGPATAGVDYQAPISAAGVLKGAGGGSVGVATAGTDYQAPITATGVLKGAGGGSVSPASPGTDYQAAITASGILKGAGGGSVSAAVAGTDYQAPIAAGTYQAPISATGILKSNGTSGNVSAATAGTDYQAAISASGLLKGAGGGSVSAAVAGTDYQAPTVFTSKLTATFTQTTVTPAPTGISVPVLSGHYYGVQCGVPYAPGATTTGIHLAIVVPAGGAGTNFYMTTNNTAANNAVITSGTAGYQMCSTSGSSTSGTAGCIFTDAPSTSVNAEVTISGQFKAGGNGNFVLEAASEVGGSNFNMKASSFCSLTDLGT